MSTTTGATEPTIIMDAVGRLGTRIIELEAKLPTADELAAIAEMTNAAEDGSVPKSGCVWVVRAYLDRVTG